MGKIERLRALAKKLKLGRDAVQGIIVVIGLVLLVAEVISDRKKEAKDGGE